MAGIAAVENIHRKDLTILELGRLFVRMLDEGYTQEDIAGQIGKDRGYVVNRLRVVRAPADVQQLVLEKPDSLRAVSTLVKVDNTTMRTAMIEALKQGRVTTDDLPGYQTALEQEGRTAQLPPVTSPVSKRREPGSGVAPSPSHESDDHTPEGEIGVDEGTNGTELGQGLSPYATDFALMQTRVGQAKLATVLRNLKGYREGLRRRSPLTLSQQERESLIKIEALLQEIQTIIHIPQQ
jgi:hypothetical protein